MKNQIEEIKEQVKKGRELHFGNNFVRRCPSCSGRGLIDCSVDEADDLEYRSQYIFADENDTRKV